MRKVWGLRMAAGLAAALPLTACGGHHAAPPPQVSPSTSSITGTVPSPQGSLPSSPISGTAPSPQNSPPSSPITASSPPHDVVWKGTPLTDRVFPGEEALSSIPGGGKAVGIGRSVFIDRSGRWTTVPLKKSLAVSSIVFTTAQQGLLYAQEVDPQQNRFDVYQTTDGGMTWSLIQSGGPSSLPSPVERIVYASGSYWAVDSPGRTFQFSYKDVRQSRDGKTWTRVSSLPSGTIALGVAQGPRQGVWFALTRGPKGGLALDRQGKISEVLNTPEPLYDVAFSGSFGMAVGGMPWDKFSPRNSASQAVYVTTDGGNHWTLAYHQSHAAAGFSRISLVSAKVAYALAGQVDPGANGPGYQSLYRTDDGGKTWSRILSGEIAGMLATPQSVLVDENGVVMASQDAGKTWRPVFPSTLPVIWAGFDRRDPAQGWVAVDAGLTRFLLKTTDGGATWSPVRILQSNQRPVAWFSQGGGIIQTPSGLETVNASTSTSIPLPVKGTDVRSAVFVSPTTGWLVAGPTSTLYFTQDRGRHWHTVPMQKSVALTAVKDASHLTVSDLNGNWQTVPGGGIRRLGTNLSLSAMAWNPDGDLWFAGTKNHALKMTPTIWVVAPGGQVVRTLKTAIVPAAWGFSGRAFGWALLPNEALYLSHDGGNTWTHQPLDIQTPLTQTAASP